MCAIKISIQCVCTMLHQLLLLYIPSTKEWKLGTTMMTTIRRMMVPKSPHSSQFTAFSFALLLMLMCLVYYVINFTQPPNLHIYPVYIIHSISAIFGHLLCRDIPSLSSFLSNTIWNFIFTFSHWSNLLKILITLSYILEYMYSP